MTSNDTFFQEKKPAAVLKHALLNEYVKVFASAVGSRSPTTPIWVIDGYAGAGAYSDNDVPEVQEEGSPLVTLRMAESMQRRTIKTILIEADQTIARRLRENVAPFKARGLSVSVLQGVAEERIAEAWDMAGGDPVVTFLDPFGISMRRDQMENLLLSRPSRAAPSEVLVNINLEGVWRIGGNLVEEAGQLGVRDRQQKGVERADKFFGGSWWRGEFIEVRQQNLSAADAARHVVGAYRNSIQDRTGYSSMAIPVRRRPSSQPIFHLTLFYRHPLAGYKFADAAARATKRWRNAYRTKELEEHLGDPETPGLFGREELMAMDTEEAERQEERLTEEWIGEICANLRSIPGNRIPIRDNIELILGTSLGLAGEPHIRKAWDRLAEAGFLRRRDKTKKMDALAMERA